MTWRDATFSSSSDAQRRPQDRARRAHRCGHRRAAVGGDPVARPPRRAPRRLHGHPAARRRAGREPGPRQRRRHHRARSRRRRSCAASRARIVEAGDAERRRLERNLHDGAQQRLVSLSLALRLAQARARRATRTARMLLVARATELAHALEELRELARGIHPAVLTDRGLGPALEALADADAAPGPADARPASGCRPRSRRPPSTSSPRPSPTWSSTQMRQARASGRAR